MAKNFHPLLAMIASGTDRDLAKYVQFLKAEDKILRARIPGEVHTKPDERQRLLEFGKALGRAIEELITIVSARAVHTDGPTIDQPLSRQDLQHPLKDGVMCLHVDQSTRARQRRMIGRRVLQCQPEVARRLSESSIHQAIPRSESIPSKSKMNEVVRNR